jgi:L-iditol 2-dehydrogenase
MKAAILKAQGVITYEEIPTPEPAPGNVRMQVKAASICGSDLKRYLSGHRTYPMILGHECSGTIDMVGQGVDQKFIGKHISVIPLIPCFQCSSCKHGFFSACSNYSFIGSRQPGGFADYLELPVGNILPIPNDVSFERSALIEPSTVAKHMLTMGKFSKGESALVLGVGSIGLLIVQWLRILGADPILAADISDESLEFSQKMGAHVTINLKNKDLKDEVFKHTENGVDIAFEVAGVPQTLKQSVLVVRPHGRVVLAGNQPVDQALPLSFIEDMIRRELSLIGNHMSFSAPFPGAEWPDSIIALQKNQLDMDNLISHRFSLSEAPEVFSKIKSKSLNHRKIMFFPENS